MLDASLLERFLESVAGQPRREGRRYAARGAVKEFAGSRDHVSATVEGAGDDYEVLLWSEEGELRHSCSCPSWRSPCKHVYASVLALAARSRVEVHDVPRGSPAPLAERWADWRRAAVQERVAAAGSEPMRVRRVGPAEVRVQGESGYAYTVQVRGGAAGPHGCTCPDFEANRLHTCKHVERVRRYLARARLPRAFREAASRARVYLHFGESVEPRLYGVPSGRGARALRESFDSEGRALRNLARGEEELRAWMARFGRRVEPEALAWLDERIARTPQFDAPDVKALLPVLPHPPYPFQRKGIEFLARKGRALLADEMGLGKTVQAILAAYVLRSARRPLRSVTIVCPASLRGGWRDEIHSWLGEEALLLEGRHPQRAEVVASRPTWLVTHYEQVLRDRDAHAAAPPDLLIIDEAQRAKGIATKTARAIKSIPARHVFALTGTPLENRLEEAYSIAQLIDQRLLPPLWQVDRDHFVREGKGRRVVMYKNLDALRSRLAPAFLRRCKEDVQLELPERLRSVSFVPMHAAVVETYEDLMSQVARIAARVPLPPHQLERLQRLLLLARRCCNGPHMLGRVDERTRIPKLEELREILVDLCRGEGRKAVVFSEWTDMTEEVEALCARIGLPAFHLSGKVPVRKRPDLIRSFSELPGPAVFISTDAGGVGLNLQAADVVVNLDLPWNPARLEQRIARVHRIGSSRPVQILLLVTEDSLEERMLGLHETKRGVLENVWSSDGEDVIAAPGGSGAFQAMVQGLVERQPSPGEPDDVVEPESPQAVSIDPAALAEAVAGVAPTLPPEHRRSLAAVFRTLADALDGERSARGLRGGQDPRQ